MKNYTVDLFKICLSMLALLGQDEFVQNGEQTFDIEHTVKITTVMTKNHPMWVGGMLLLFQNKTD